MRRHYGWAVCAAGTILLFITMGMVSNGFSVYLPFILNEYGLTNTQTSSLVTLRCVVSFCCMLLIGFYYKKFSIRAGTGIAAGCAGLSFLIYSVADSYPLFGLGAAISGMGYGLGSMIPVSILMNRWFVERRTLALSICGTGSGIATIILPPLLTALIERFSLQQAFRIEFVFILILTAVVVLLIRNTPEEKGLRPYGAERAAQTEQKSAAGYTGPSFGPSRKQWAMLFGVCLCMGALANPGFSHLSVLYTTEGFSAGNVALLLSVSGITIAVGKVIYGQVTDKLGGEKSSYLYCLLLLAGHLLCCLAFTGNMALAVLNMIVIGGSYSIATIGPSVWSNDLSSPDVYPVAVRRLQVIYAGGALLFASVPGILADLTGRGYIPAYLLFSGMLAAATVCVALVYREKRRNQSR